MAKKNGNGHFKIERGIPVPEHRGTGPGKGPLAQAISKMETGDSLFAVCQRGQINQAAQRYIGKGKYTIRSEGEGFRVWKTV